MDFMPDFSLLTYAVGIAAAFSGGFIDSIAGGGGLVTMVAGLDDFLLLLVLARVGFSLAH